VITTAEPVTATCALTGGLPGEEDRWNAAMINSTPSAMPMMSSGFEIPRFGGAPHDGQLLGFKLMIFWPHLGHVTSAIENDSACEYHHGRIVCRSAIKNDSGAIL